MKVYKHHEYCASCGREYAYITLDGERERCECGGRLNRLQLPLSVRKRREKEAPPPMTVGKQRKDLTQDQYNQLGRILQGWGYDTYDIANAVAAIKYTLGVA